MQQQSNTKTATPKIITATDNGFLLPDGVVPLAEQGRVALSPEIYIVGVVTIIDNVNNNY